MNPWSRQGSAFRVGVGQDEEGGWFDDAWDSASSWADDTASSVSDTWDSASSWVDDAASSVSDAWDTATDVVSDAYDDASEWVSDAYDQATDVASDVAQEAADLAADCGPDETFDFDTYECVPFDQMSGADLSCTTEGGEPGYLNAEGQCISLASECSGTVEFNADTGYYECVTTGGLFDMPEEEEEEAGQSYDKPQGGMPGSGGPKGPASSNRGTPAPKQGFGPGENPPDRGGPGTPATPGTPGTPGTPATPPGAEPEKKESSVLPWVIGGLVVVGGGAAIWYASSKKKK